MATKAEEFRYWTERSGPKKAKRPKGARRDVPVDTARPGVSATDRRAARGEDVPRVAKKAPYALERSAAKPSLRSTRKAGNRQRTDTKMQAQARTSRGRPRGGGSRDT